MPMDKQWKKLLRDLGEQGWTVKPTKKGYMLYPRDKTMNPVAIHKTPSDRRSWANTIADLRRSGFKP